MKNINVILSEDNRSINVSYKIIDEEYDNHIFHKIMEIVRKDDLSCRNMKDSNNVRSFYISGIIAEDVTKTYEEIEKLN